MLLDLTMPVMDGFSFLERLRGEKGHADVPVVDLSARDVSFNEGGRLAGVDRVVRKGDVDLRRLASEIGQIGSAPRLLRAGVVSGAPSLHEYPSRAARPPRPPHEVRRVLQDDWSAQPFDLSIQLSGLSRPPRLGTERKRPYAGGERRSRSRGR